ncbi:MAG: DNA internalization-related competence protein ComEC/Rec2 [Candidatus Kuenenia sp.]|nr:DNA internalization-related competence protein ComEC/Rec2 [Candidatus Kuenenia hertensis]
MQRPIIPITLLFICGVYLGSLTEIPLHITLGICLMIWMVCFFCLFLTKNSTVLLIFMPVLVIALSVAYFDCRNDFLPDNHIAHTLSAKKSIQRVRGTIIKPPVILKGNAPNKRLLQYQSETFNKSSDYKISFIIQTNEIETVSGWKKSSGYIKVNVYLPHEDLAISNKGQRLLHQLVYGQKVELFGCVYLPKTPGNPGEFNYKTYLKRQKHAIHSLMTIINTDNIEISGVHPRNLFYGFMYALKNYLNNTIYTHTFSNSAPLISSMLLGDRVGLSEETIDTFIKTGIIHFIAISGFHVGIVIVTVLFPLRALGVNQTVTIGIIVSVTLLYAFLTGFNPPVQRASIMAIVFFFGYLVHRQWDITSSIFTAILFILLRNPSDLFNIGFQLSILATMGIVYGASKIEATLFRTVLFVEKLQVPEERGRLFLIKKYIRKLFCISLAAWIATLPLTAYYFHLFTPYVSIASIIVFPLFWIVIVSGIVLLISGIAFPPLASVFAWLASATDIVLESLVTTLSHLPYSHFYVIGPSLTGILVYYSLLLLILYRTYLSISYIYIALWGLLSANILTFSGIIKSHSHSLKLTCLDVGHGGALFIQFPNGKNILYDAGTWHNYDAGRNIAAPFLWSEKVKKIDLVILSHEHNDHWNGLPSIIERFSVKRVYSQPYFFKSETGRRILGHLQKKNIRTAALFHGLEIKGFEPATVKVFHPSLFSLTTSTTNDNSCVVMIEYIGRSILLCGDIQRQGIKALLSKQEHIKSDIIQIPHHGSSSNNLQAFIDMVQPSYAFINSHDNTVSHKTIDVLHNRSIITTQTHKDGAITFLLGKNGITYSVYRN